MCPVIKIDVTTGTFRESAKFLTWSRFVGLALKGWEGTMINMMGVSDYCL